MGRAPALTGGGVDRHAARRVAAGEGAESRTQGPTRKRRGGRGVALTWGHQGGGAAKRGHRRLAASPAARNQGRRRRRREPQAARRAVRPAKTRATYPSEVPGAVFASTGSPGAWPGGEKGGQARPLAPNPSQKQERRSPLLAQGTLSKWRSCSTLHRLARKPFVSGGSWLTRDRGSLLFPLPEAKRATATGAAKPTRAKRRTSRGQRLGSSPPPRPRGLAKAKRLHRRGDVCLGTQLFENKGGP
jgi:hypothetical protein